MQKLSEAVKFLRAAWKHPHTKNFMELITEDI